MSWHPPTKLTCIDVKKAQSYLDDLIAKLDDSEHKATLDALGAGDNCESEFANFLMAVFTFSPYLRDRILLNPEILNEIISSGLDVFSKNTLHATAHLGLEGYDEAQMMARLRQMKLRIAIVCGLGDLGGWWNCEKVTATLSNFADASLVAAIDFMLLSASAKQQFKLKDINQPQIDCGLIVLAMGKHGAFELNYSSDIDLILFFDDQAASRVCNIDPTTFFSRFAKLLVRLLQERTSDNYVFRVDLRLRPDPSSTPPIMPLEAALIYYESYGQNWERAAMIKARPAAGDIKAGNNFLKEITPFIWRKYLDFAAIREVHSIKRQIHANKGHATIATRGHNIKLGRGGIREIEFFAQTQQLIAGGRIPQLRTIRTIETLNILCQHDWIDTRVVEDLTDAYWFLRDVEHRLQMVRDEQTHTLPTNESEFLTIALMMGFMDSKEFTQKLTAILQSVEKHYSSLFETSPEPSTAAECLVFTGEEEDPQTIETLSAMGYKRPSDIMRTIKGWHFGRYAALSTPQARELLSELIPSLLYEFAQTGRADDTLIAMDRFISGLPAGIQLFALLNSNPPLMRLLTLLLSVAPRLADIITRRPHVFDGLLDPAFNTTLPEKEIVARRLDQFLCKGNDYESILNRARIFAAEQKFLIGVRLINGTINAAQAGLALSDLAQVMINAMILKVKIEFEERHGQVENSAICVLAMGRLGSCELTSNSDLDLIFLYDHSEDCEQSNGPKPLPVSQYFTRLIQRLTAAMSAPTAQGVIYELDFRLRPSGNAGPLATHVSSFFKYQREQAWTWERQALTRSRVVAGDQSMCIMVDREIGNLIARPCQGKELKSEIAQMRYHVENEKGSKNIWDCKNAKGGLTDVEFIAQWLVLTSGKFPPKSARNTRSVLHSFRGSIISQDDCDALLGAHDLYTTIIQLLRSCINSELDPDTAPWGLMDVLRQGVGSPDVADMGHRLKNCQHQVREIFTRLIG